MPVKFDEDEDAPQARNLESVMPVKFDEGEDAPQQIVVQVPEGPAPSVVVNVDPTPVTIQVAPTPIRNDVRISPTPVNVHNNIESPKVQVTVIKEEIKGPAQWTEIRVRPIYMQNGQVEEYVITRKSK